jgi:hypothetical protein
VKPFDPSRIILGPGPTYLESFVRLLEAYDRKGHPVVVFIEPQLHGSSLNAYLYRFFGLNFMIEMVAMPNDKDRNDAALGKVAVLVDTLCNAQESTIRDGSVQI